MTAYEFRKYIEAQRIISGLTAKKYAENIGISASHYSDVINGRRDPGNKILSSFNMIRNVTFVHIDSKEEK